MACVTKDFKETVHNHPLIISLLLLAKILKIKLIKKILVFFCDKRWIVKSGTVSRLSLERHQFHVGGSLYKNL